MLLKKSRLKLISLSTFRSQVEFAVQMSGPGCAKKVEDSLQDVGSVDIDVPTGRVTVNTNLPWVEIQEKIERTGRRAVLSGFGGMLLSQFIFVSISQA